MDCDGVGKETAATRPTSSTKGFARCVHLPGRREYQSLVGHISSKENPADLATKVIGARRTTEISLDWNDYARHHRLSLTPLVLRYGYEGFTGSLALQD